MKYLKKYKIFEATEAKVLVNRLRNAFEDTEFEIDEYETDENGITYIRIHDANDGEFYEFDEDDFDEETLRTAIENEDINALSRDVKREFERLHKVILDVLNTPRTSQNEWWLKEIDNANNKQLAKLKENITKNPSWILRREEIEQFFQDAIDDVGDEYKYQLQIISDDGEFIPYYILDFDYDLDLKRGSYAQSLSGLSKLLDTIHRAVRRLEVEDLNLKVFVTSTPYSHRIETKVKILSTRDILSGSTIDVEPEEEPTTDEQIEELRRRVDYYDDED